LYAPTPLNAAPVQVANFGTSMATLIVGANDATASFAGVLTDGSLGIQGEALSLVKIGTGTQTLSGTNSYYGSTTISNGTLALAGNGSISNSLTIDIAAGGTLDAAARTNGGITIEYGPGAIQTLSGIGTINGATVVAQKGAIAPFLGTIGALKNNGNLTLASGALYLWDINEAGGTAGSDPGWSQLIITGGLTVSGPFTINVISLTLADAPGAVAGFNNARSYSWSIAHTTAGVSGFSQDMASVNTGPFANSLGSGKFIVTTNATDLLLSFAVPPAITGIHVNAVSNTVSISGTNGPPNVTYRVLSSTNVTAHLTNWIQNGASTFSGNGSFTFNGSIAPADTQRYYVIVSP
jgi:fibronectin-binding autotransporter adhesin